MALTRSDRRLRIKRRIRKTISGTANRPRLAVFRSNKDIYAQLIDDVNRKTLASYGSLNVEDTKGQTKTEQAAVVGKMIADVAKNAGVESVVFDRSGYLYHGRVKALAEAARKGGLKF
jgi:large subunit ribosomal protein L18